MAIKQINYYKNNNNNFMKNEYLCLNSNILIFAQCESH